MSEIAKQNSDIIQWGMRGLVGALFVVLGILYNNERDARIEISQSLKEVSEELTTIERNFQDFQKDVIRSYVNSNDFEKNNTILLDINSSLSELVERLIRLETRFDVQNSN